MRVAFAGSPEWTDAGIIRSAVDKLVKRHTCLTARILETGEATRIAIGGLPRERIEIEDFTEDAPYLMQRAWKTVPPFTEVDLLVAFWDGSSVGTAVWLDRAKEAGVTAWVIRPDGNRYRYC